MPPREFQGILVSKHTIGKNLLVLRIKCSVSPECKPGEFVNVLVPSPGTDPFLRRPFSVAWAEPGNEIIELNLNALQAGKQAAAV